MHGPHPYGRRPYGALGNRAVAATLGAIGALGFVALAPAGHHLPLDVAQASTSCHRVDDGTKRDDRMVGTPVGDLIRSRAGADEVSGAAGADCLRGGSGPDVIGGGGGRDTIRGGSGHDRIDAADGVGDVIWCGSGVDLVVTDEADVLHGCEEPQGPPPTSTGCEFDPGTVTAPGCAVVSSDTGVAADPSSLWGSVECANASRQQRETSGGDSHPMSTGAPQPDDAFRQLTVFDGDDYSGERCELGRNDYRYGENGGDGTFALYREGQHRTTFSSMLIPSSLPINGSDWQAVLQMKQAQPSANGGASPIIELELHDGRFILEAGGGSFWSTPATTGQWVRVALDVTYSQDPGLGSVQMYIDSNGDGDATDPNEQSPVFHGSTLKQETAPGSDSVGAVAPGQSIPSHLRTGIYHNPAYSCPSGCSIDVDNIQVAAR